MCVCSRIENCSHQILGFHTNAHQGKSLLLNWFSCFLLISHQNDSESMAMAVHEWGHGILVTQIGSYKLGFLCRAQRMSVYLERFPPVKTCKSTSCVETGERLIIKKTNRFITKEKNGCQRGTGWAKWWRE